MHQIPLAGNFCYDGTEDVLEFRGLGKRDKTGLMRQDLQKRRRFQELVQDRRKELAF